MPMPKCQVCGYSTKKSNDPTRTLKRCSGCEQVYYCSKECQEVDWHHGHSEICKATTAMSSASLLQKKPSELSTAQTRRVTSLAKVTDRIQASQIEAYIQNMVLKRYPKEFRHALQQEWIFRSMTHEEAVFETMQSRWWHAAGLLFRRDLAAANEARLSWPIIRILLGPYAQRRWMLSGNCQPYKGVSHPSVRPTGTSAFPGVVLYDLVGGVTADPWLDRAIADLQRLDGSTDIHTRALVKPRPHASNDLDENDVPAMRHLLTPAQREWLRSLAWAYNTSNGLSKTQQQKKELGQRRIRMERRHVLGLWTVAMLEAFRFLVQSDHASYEPSHDEQMHGDGDDMNKDEDIMALVRLPRHYTIL